MKPHAIRIICVLILLAGCAPETPNPETATAPPAAATPSRVPASPVPTPEETLAPVEPIGLSPEDIAGVRIEVWHVWDGEREALLQDLVAGFNAANSYEIQVTAVRQADLQGDVARALAAGAPPDLAFGASYHVRSWARVSDPVDWTPYLQDPQWGLSPQDRADFYPAFLAAAAFDGIQAGLPFYRTAEVLLYNRTWAAELGFGSPPDTPEALAEQACAANAFLRSDADPGNDGEGGLLLGYDPDALAAWMAAFGGAVGPLAEGEAYAFDRAENTAAFDYLRGLLDDHCAWLPEGVYPHDEFAGRRGLLLPSTLAGLGPQAEAMAAAGSLDDWGPIPYPAAGAGRTPLLHGPDLVLLASTPERRLAAWVFARWLLDPENLARWSDATGYLPVRRSAPGFMPDPPVEIEGWIDAGAMFTPPASWVDVQFAVGEMARILFSPFTPTADVQALAVELDTFAEELDQLSRAP